MQLEIESRVTEVCNNPRMGQHKAGDLQGVFVYKFRFNRQEYLMAYQFDYFADAREINWIQFCQIGPHENFYTQLKNRFDSNNHFKALYKINKVYIWLNS